MDQTVEDASNQFETFTIRLRDKILSDISELETSMGVGEGDSEQRLKSLTGFFKLLQSVEEMIKRIQQERDKKSDRGVDILEFRKELEKKISKLVDNKAEGVVS